MPTDNLSQVNWQYGVSTKNGYYFVEIQYL